MSEQLSDKKLKNEYKSPKLSHPQIPQQTIEEQFAILAQLHNQLANKVNIMKVELKKSNAKYEILENRFKLLQEQLNFFKTQIS